MANIPLIIRVRALAAFYIFVVFIAGVCIEGAWSDDYAAFLDPQAIGLHAIRDGRLIYGGLIQFFFGQISDVNGLVLIRLFGLLGIMLLNDLIILQLSKKSMPILISIATSAAFTLPSFQFSSHWAIAFGMSWAAYLSVLGFIQFRNTSRLGLISGSILVTSSLLIYPLMSFFVVAFVYAEIQVKRINLRPALRLLRHVGIYLLSGIAIGALLSYWFLRLNNLEANPRVALVDINDIPTKIFWFFSRPFAVSFRPFLIDSPTLVGILTFSSALLLILIFLFFRKQASLGGVIEELATLFLFLIFSLLPILLASQNQIDMRFVGSNTWIVCFVLVYQAGSLIENLARDKLRFFTKGLSALLLLIFCLITVNDRYFSFIRPVYLSNQRFLSQSIDGCDREQIEKGIFVLDRTLSWKSKPFIGVFSQYSDFESEWVPRGAIQLFLSSRQMNTNGIERQPEATVSSEYCTIDLNQYEILSARIEK